MAEQTSTGYFQNPFKFNRKSQRSEDPDPSGELDEERRSPREHQKIKRREQTGLYYYGARYYDPRGSWWLSVDPLMEKYAGWSPYNYALNNPVRLIDPTGRDVVITGEDGKSKTYSPIHRYEGNDKFIIAMSKRLNQMYSTRIGKRVLDRLIYSKNTVELTNKASKAGTAAFRENEQGGGKVHLNGETGLSTVSHELFHAYQHENGHGGASIFNEVQAYVFSKGVCDSYFYRTGITTDHFSFPLSRNGSESKNGKIFEDAMFSIIYGNQLDEGSFQRAVNLFKTESGANTNNIYNKHQLRLENQKINPLKQFYPLIEYPE